MALILSLALAAFFVELNIAKDDSAEDSTVTKVTLNNGVDLNKPIIDISGWQLPSEMDYDTLSQQVNGVIVRVQHGISMKKKIMRLFKMAKTKPWIHTFKSFKNVMCQLLSMPMSMVNLKKKCVKKPMNFMNVQKNINRLIGG